MKLEEGKRKLPDGWRWVKLGEISRLVSGSTPPRGNSENFRGTIPWVKTLDLNCDVVSQTEECISESAFAQIRGEILPMGTVMIAMYGGSGTIGKSGILGLPATTNQAICSILPNSNVFLPEFLHAWLLLIRPEWMQYSSGNRRDPNINKGVVEQMMFPLPPLDEQKRIAAILNEKMEAVERSRQATLAQLEAAKALPSAYLRAVFNSPEAQKWERKQIGQMAKVQSGYAFKSEWFVEDGIKLLRNANVSQGFISWNDTVYLPLNRYPEFKAYELCVGDIILSLDRPVVNNGLKVARLSNNDIPSLLLQRVGRFKIIRAIDSEYFYNFLKSAQFIGAITKHDQSIGVPHISPAQVEAIEIPIPPISEQQRISATLSQQMTEVEKLRKALEEQLDAINQLPATFLRQVFNGELET